VPEIKLALAEIERGLDEAASQAEAFSNAFRHWMSWEGDAVHGARKAIHAINLKGIAVIPRFDGGIFPSGQRFEFDSDFTRLTDEFFGGGVSCYDVVFSRKDAEENGWLILRESSINYVLVDGKEVRVEEYNIEILHRPTILSPEQEKFLLAMQAKLKEKNKEKAERIRIKNQARVAVLDVGEPAKNLAFAGLAGLLKK
jgi:hypothetical protein